MAIRTLLASLCCLLTAFAATAADKPKRLLFVTHSGGFIHDSVGVAEDLLNEFGPKAGYTVTTFRYTGDPADAGFKKYQEDFRKRTGKAVESENCGRINKETLKNFDVVLFFTTGGGPKRKNLSPLTTEELADLTEWVRAGGSFAGTHCASDTMYDTTYGSLIGGYFRTHPAIQKVTLKLEDPKHPAAAGITDGMIFEDEYYIMSDAPYSREKLHVIVSIDSGWKPKDGKGVDLARKDGDHAVVWCKEEGKGKVFYTSLGHRKEVWKDERFQKHLIGGLDWAVNKLPGDASPGKGK